MTLLVLWDSFARLVGSIEDYLIICVKDSCMSEKPSELSNGTEVYFETGVGTVFKGTIVGRDELQKHYAFSQYEESDNLVRVDIDFMAQHTEDGLPDHMAPDQYQPPDDDAVFRDAYTIDAEEQHYIVTQQNLVEVLD